MGDACDDDIDGDGQPNEQDACPSDSSDRCIFDDDADGDGFKDTLVIGSGDDWSCWVLGQTVRCIGWESYPYPNVTRLIEVPAGFGVPEKIVGGLGYICGLTQGSLQCFGPNSAWLPTDANDIVEIAAHSEKLCAIKADHRVQCWEKDATSISGAVPANLQQPHTLRLSSVMTCVIDNYQLHCWGDLAEESMNTITFGTPRDVFLERNFCVRDDAGWHCANPYFFPASVMNSTSKLFGVGTVCALSSGDLLCFSSDAGDEMSLDSSTPRPQAVSAGANHVCWVANSRIKCSGSFRIDEAFPRLDNCPSTYNPDQFDSNLDGVGNACDSDNDGVSKEIDNCPSVYNPWQEDVDNDTLGDDCDWDMDNDGLANVADNCPYHSNPLQTDWDFDGLGDACDDDIDGDSLLNTEDNCPHAANRDQLDMNGDGLGDACDDDIDGDGFANTQDNCRLVANSDQADMDTDAIGDSCDNDVDGDGLAHVENFVWGSGYRHTCWYANGELSCIGDYPGYPIELPAYFGQPSKISGGEGYTCGLVGDSLRCFGVDTNWLPNNLSGVSDFDAAPNNLCAIADGVLQCWSRGEESIINVPSLSNPRKVTVEGSAACAIDDNDVHCWGYGLPVRRFSVVNPVDVVAGEGFACIKDDSGWRCWGPFSAFDSSVDLQVAGNLLCSLEERRLRCFVKSQGVFGLPNEMQWVDYATVGTNHICTINNQQLRCEGDIWTDQTLELLRDNCPLVANADQADLDGDGIGDVCDDDIDGDEVSNEADNCPLVVNLDQANLDSDAYGDLCDDDIDGDGVANEDDDCPNDASDHCILDDDNDGVLNGVDNCPQYANADQADLDADGVGDTCDDDLDGDGLLNEQDGCPNDDTNYCIQDDDNDGALNGVDNCLQHANSDQADLDEDGIGDVCDDDIDGDGIVNPTPIVWGSGYDHTCWVAGGELQCLGRAAPQVPANLGVPRQVAGGEFFTCALVGTTLHCFGQGLGEMPALMDKVSQFAVGSDDSSLCVVRNNAVQCWDRWGGDIDNIPTLTNPRQIVVGYYLACAIDDSGVVCWSWGGGEPPLPEAISNPIKVVLSNGSVCLNDDAGWRCNGYNSPSAILVVAEATILAGAEGFCSLAAGQVQCWGSNIDNVPADLGEATALTVGSFHACAIAEGRLRCWGFINEDRPLVPERDNCSMTPNPDQADLDGDGLGDACDDDIDGDGVNNDEDIFPRDPAEWQDTDSDGLGDNVDNCPFVANADQANFDGDEFGDICDNDIDGDYAPNEQDNCPLIANGAQTNLDGDALGDACDDDIDGDTVANELDNCPLIANADQANLDGDSLGDVCDDDIDRDGIPNQHTMVWGSGFGHTCWVLYGGMNCTGDYYGYGYGYVPYNFGVPSKIGAGEYYTCGLVEGVLKCFDANWLPTELHAVSDFAAGPRNLCALVDGTVQCWAQDDDYVIYVPYLSHPRKLDVDKDTACALDDRGVQCWGRAIAPSPYTFENPVDLVVGYGTACVKDDAGWRCWGNNAPAVEFGVDAQLSAYFDQICALEDERVRCWRGGEEFTLVPHTQPATYMTVGGNHACIIFDNRMKCYGAFSVDREFWILNDNCPFVPNISQADLDGDGVGDDCDDDIDGDGVNNDEDIFPRDPAEWQDTDGDSIGDNADNCPLMSNEDQADLDADGIGDACDDDIDGDGTVNDLDPNPYVAELNLLLDGIYKGSRVIERVGW